MPPLELDAANTSRRCPSPEPGHLPTPKPPGRQFRRTWGVTRRRAHGLTGTPGSSLASYVIARAGVRVELTRTGWVDADQVRLEVRARRSGPGREGAGHASTAPRPDARVGPSPEGYFPRRTGLRWATTARMSLSDVGGPTVGQRTALAENRKQGDSGPLTVGIDVSDHYSHLCVGQQKAATSALRIRRPS